ncbi:MAG: hypothetical protein NMNS02_03890 [Nitrosomonas sp.]|nr:MAG: hypothetical protein NMNS02_03890 [Nitrosomonas sp.]
MRRSVKGAVEFELKYALRSVDEQSLAQKLLSNPKVMALVIDMQTTLYGRVHASA